MGPATIRKTFAARIRKLMEAIRKELTEAGYYCGGLWDDDGDYYSWSFLCHTQGKPEEGAELSQDHDIDIRFIIAESEYWDGERGGVNFMLDIVAVGGRIVGGLTPHNYTPECWVPRRDNEAVKDRFQIMENTDPHDVVPLIEDYIEGLKKEATPC